MSVFVCRTRKIGTLSVITVLTLLLTGCGGSDSSANASGNNNQVKGVSVPSQISVVTPTE